MASIPIRNLNDGLRRRLRTRAAEHGRSMEREAREILRQAVGRHAPPANLGIDTNVISELMRSKPAPAGLGWFGRQDAAARHLSAVGKAEVRRGAVIQPDGQRRGRGGGPPRPGEGDPDRGALPMTSLGLE